MCSSAIAQDSTVYFYDEQGETTVALEDAVYYRIVVPKGSLTHIRHYYASNDQLIFEGTFSRIGSSLEREGPYKSFYKNGKVESEGSYSKDRRVGLWKDYYANGQQSDEKFYSGEKVVYNQHWDKAGDPKLVYGNGTFTTGKQHVEVVDSVVFTEFSVDTVSGDSIYVVVEESARYKEGMDKFFEDVAKDLKYPKLARQYRVQGKVFVAFVVDKSGKLHNAKVVQGIGGGCDEAAVEALQKRTMWVPARVRGKTVVQRMVLPIAFRLK